MPDNLPRVTIGVPVYNGARTMRETLDSLLSQTYRDFVLLISDNASEDETPDLCNEYQKRDDRVRYMRQDTNLGVVRNVNTLLKRAETELFMWHAVDDVSYPRMLEACVSALDARPEAVHAYVQAETIDDEGRVVPHAQHPLNLGSPDVVRRFEDCLEPMEFTENVIYGLMRRTEALRTQLHGNFAGGDRAFCADLTLYGPFARVDETLFKRRLEKQPKTAEEVSLYNTGRSEAVSLREWRILRHNILSITRAPLSTAQRARLGAALVRRLGRRQHAYMAEIKGLVRTTLGV